MQIPLLFFRCSKSQMEEMASSSSFPSFLSQGEVGSQAGSAGAQSLPGRMRVTNSQEQRNRARERERSRSPQWGNERRRSFTNTTNHNNSAGRRRRRRKKTSPSDHDNTDSDATVPGPSKRSFQPPPAHRAAYEQRLSRERQQRRPSQQGCELCSQIVKLREHNQSESKSRKH